MKLLKSILLKCFYLWPGIELRPTSTSLRRRRAGRNSFHIEDSALSMHKDEKYVSTVRLSCASAVVDIGGYGSEMWSVA
jgi:hypothetical protein